MIVINAYIYWIGEIPRKSFIKNPAELSDISHY